MERVGGMKKEGEIGREREAGQLHLNYCIVGIFRGITFPPFPPLKI